ncbi:MAG: helix-turn-helix domain-containing protein [Azospirillaceae bacterium]|nr:helix-turn-helix domain-containing protein [Azospirillaceae bacterium]
MKRRSLTEDPCPVARALDVIGDWWSLLIVRDALEGPRRFGDFQRNLGISKGILAARLRDLVTLGILESRPPADGGTHQDYALTAKGRALFPVIVGLRQWGEDHCYAPDEAYSRLVDSHTGQPVGRLEVRRADGKALACTDALVRHPAKD